MTGVIYRRGTVAALACACFGGSVSAAAVRYSLVDMGTLGGETFTYGAAINSAGQVVGRSSIGNNQIYHAYLYDHGTMVDLGTHGNPYSSEATGINDAGQIVGSFGITLAGISHAFVIDHGVMTDIGTPGVVTSVAYGINRDGVVVGADAGEAFRYDGSMTELAGVGSPSGPSEGRAINARGQIVGQTNVQPFIYDGGTITMLGSLGGTYGGNALAVNDAGDVVGFAYITNNKWWHAFLYHGGTMADLGVLGDVSRSTSQAQGINNLGQIVGNSTTSAGTNHAFIYTDGAMYDLNNLTDFPAGRWTLTSAVAINDAGQIVCNGVNPYAQQRAFLLTPVPEPGVFAVAGGLLAVGAGRAGRGRRAEAGVRRWAVTRR